VLLTTDKDYWQEFTEDGFKPSGLETTIQAVK
jgi:hypothetical protein